jgi:murein DD-endopeptidase MepM/ murein hydrolase activator NlpD
MPDNLNFAIHGSVGRKSKGAKNNSDDIETVQSVLRLAAMIAQDPRLDPGAVDGAMDADESNDDTVKAIEAFQAKFMLHPDGVINVGKHTWQELMKALEGDGSEGEPAVTTAPSANVTGADPFFFPFTQLPLESWTDGMRAFGSRRDKGARVHAGCDLWFPVGTTIHAITSGIVRATPYLFYHSTDALEIDHGTFVARYGEIKKGSALLIVGDKVSGGQEIAKVGKLDNMSISMLHLELYDKSVAGALTVKTNQTKRNDRGLPFWRRRDLMDPTAKLNEWKSNMP